MAKELTQDIYQSVELAARGFTNQEIADQLDVYKCNVDDEGDLAQQFGILSIPTLILFKDGKAVTTMIGAKPKADIIGEITPYL